MESISSPRKRGPQSDKTSTRKTLTWLKEYYKLIVSGRLPLPHDKKKIAQVSRASSTQTRNSKFHVKCKVPTRSTTRQREFDQLSPGSHISNVGLHSAVLAIPLASISQLDLSSFAVPHSTGRARSNLSTVPNRPRQRKFLSPVAEMDPPPSVKGDEECRPEFSRPVLPSAASTCSSPQNNDRRKSVDTDLISFATPDPYSLKCFSSSFRGKEFPSKTVPSKYSTPERRGVFDASKSTSKTLNESHPPLVATYNLSGSSTSTGSVVVHPESFKMASSLCTSSGGDASSSTPAVEYGVASLDFIRSMSQESPCASKALLLRTGVNESSQGLSPTCEGFRSRYGFKNKGVLRRGSSLGYIGNRMNVTPSRIPRRIGSTADGELIPILAEDDENQIAGDSDSAHSSDVQALVQSDPSKLNKGKRLVINVKKEFHMEVSTANKDSEMGKKFAGPEVEYGAFGPGFDIENPLNVSKMRRSRRAAQFAHDKATNLRARQVYRAAGVKQPSRSPPTPIRSSSLHVNRSRNLKKSAETKEQNSPGIEPMGVVTKIWASPPRKKDESVSRPGPTVPEILKRKHQRVSVSNRRSEVGSPRVFGAAQSQSKVKPKTTNNGVAPTMPALPLPRRVPTTRIAKFRKEFKKLRQNVSSAINPPSIRKAHPEPVDKQEPAGTSREKKEWAHASDFAGDRTANGQANAPTIGHHGGVSTNGNGGGSDPPPTPPFQGGPSRHYIEDDSAEFPSEDPLLEILLADIHARCQRITRVAQRTSDPELSHSTMQLALKIGEGLIAIRNARIVVLQLSQSIGVMSFELATVSSTADPFR